jgi:Arc/MetJ-type ribon-helix-helix transcriptional regulator
MNMQLPPDVQDWIDQRVKEGAFKTPAEAIAFAVRHVVSPDDDLSWVKPLLDEARAEIARGESIRLEEFRARMRARVSPPSTPMRSTR